MNARFLAAVCIFGITLVACQLLNGSIVPIFLGLVVLIALNLLPSPSPTRENRKFKHHNAPPR